MVYVDLLTVFIAAIIFVILSGFWYSSFLFGDIWLRLKNIKKRDVKGKALFFLGRLLIALVIGYFLAFFEGYLGVSSFWDGVIAGFLIWVGFILTVQITNFLWVPQGFKLFLIDTSFWLVSLLIMGGVIAG